MKTLQGIASYIDLYARYHNEVSDETLKQMILSMISELPEEEKEKCIAEYTKWFQSKKPIVDEYVELYMNTNEAS